jgi:predicted RecA/RadA family phage recombinase
MRNYVQPGKTLTLTAPSGGVTSGRGYLIGGLLVIACVTAAENEPFAAMVEGVFTHAKTSAQAWTEGQKIYWDDTNHRFDSDSTVGPLVGVAAAVAANPSATGTVRLNGVAPATAEGAQAAVADIATADADGTYGAPEATLINELKTQVNALLARLRIAGIIAP